MRRTPHNVSSVTGNGIMLLSFCVDNLDMKLPDMSQGTKYTLKEVQRQLISAAQKGTGHVSLISCAHCLLNNPKPV